MDKMQILSSWMWGDEKQKEYWAKDLLKYLEKRGAIIMDEYKIKLLEKRICELEKKLSKS